jgi:SpoVK/Ycf46/Vps4 family AAA+-type ATPase
MFLRSRACLPSDIRNVEPIIKLWILRLLIPLECHRKLINRHGFESEELARLFELTPDADVTEEEGSESHNPFALHAKLKDIYIDAERGAASACLPEPLASNIETLATQVGLNEVESWILAFAVMITQHRMLDDSTDLLGSELNSLRVYHILSVLLGFPEVEIRQALSSQSTLSQTSLVVLENHRNSLGRKLDLLSPRFATRLLSEKGSPLDWLRDMIAPCPNPDLALSDYSHIGTSLDFLLPYLTQISTNRRKGVNVFLYGSPGTGKTQLARILAQEIGCSLYEVSSEDEDGDPVQGEQRLRAFRTAQVFFKTRQVFMLFDEVEDVFNDGNSFFGKKSTAQSRKAWMNRLLENNPVPTFWLGNSIESVDPAFIRRFDWVIELPVPPRSRREQIIRRHCAEVLNEASMRRLAACEELAPAVVSRAAEVVGSLRDQFSIAQLSAAMQQMMDKTLIAQGHPGLAKIDALKLPDLYDPAFINCDVNPNELVEGIRTQGSARLCLFGPPGTGKTAYAQWLAEQLNKPLLVKRGSDLLSKWVGGTEQNIAGTFAEAEQQNAVLLIDEVDSFLQDRSTSQHSWEISGVNEMLTRMETYQGVFIASTNYLESLDNAALRRFDLKVKFGSLKPAQAWKLLLGYCKSFGLSEPDEEIICRLEHIDNLTPGDFAVLARQHRFRPFKDLSGLLNALADECALKTPYRRQPIGFV